MRPESPLLSAIGGRHKPKAQWQTEKKGKRAADVGQPFAVNSKKVDPGGYAYTQRRAYYHFQGGMPLDFLYGMKLQPCFFSRLFSQVIQSLGQKAGGSPDAHRVP